MIRWVFSSRDRSRSEPFAEIQAAMERRPAVQKERDPWKIALLAWLVPGLGHWVQGRKGKAILYAVSIWGLFFAGWTLCEGKIVFWTWVNPLRDSENFRLSYLMQLLVGGVSLPALIQSILKSFDLPPILWGLMAEPSEDVLRSLHGRLSKLTEVGQVYTQVAGLLNIFAIFDAVYGPALPESEAVASAAAFDGKSGEAVA